MDSKEIIIQKIFESENIFDALSLDKNIYHTKKDIKNKYIQIKYILDENVDKDSLNKLRLLYFNYYLPVIDLIYNLHSCNFKNLYNMIYIHDLFYPILFLSILSFSTYIFLNIYIHNHFYFYIKFFYVFILYRNINIIISLNNINRLTFIKIIELIVPFTLISLLLTLFIYIFILILTLISNLVIHIPDNDIYFLHFVVENIILFLKTKLLNNNF